MKFCFHELFIVNVQIILDYPIDHCVSKDNFNMKFLRSGKPKNDQCISLRQGFDEILHSDAKKLHAKVGNTKDKEMIKDLINDDLIVQLQLTVN